MKDLTKIAWRNLWRNPRRTVITASSIFFAIFFAIGMRSFQLGSYDHMIKQVIESYTGYLQIQDDNYFDDPCIDNSFEANSEMIDRINKEPNVKIAVPRIESFALASTGNLSKGIIVSGISPQKELAMSNPAQKMVRYKFTKEAIKALSSARIIHVDLFSKIKALDNQSFITKNDVAAELGLKDRDSLITSIICNATKTDGRYLKDNDDGILISDRLSKYLKAGTGDSVILIGQGYHGTSAAGIFPVRGIVKLPSPELDNKIIYMTINKAQELFNLSGQYTSIAVNLKNTKEMKKTQKSLSEILGNGHLCVKNWEELNPNLKQQIEGDSKSGQMFLAILYVIIFFGIFGTVQMMISERKKEFGVMVAIGMKRGKLASIITIEMLFLGFIGTASGMLATIPLILLGYYHPIRMTGEMARMYVDIGFDPVMPMAWFEGYFYFQAVVILLMVLIASYLPVRSILRLDINKAIHGN